MRVYFFGLRFASRLQRPCMYIKASRNVCGEASASAVLVCLQCLDAALFV